MISVFAETPKVGAVLQVSMLEDQGPQSLIKLDAEPPSVTARVGLC